MVGVNGVGVIRRHQEGLAQQGTDVPVQSFRNSGQHILHIGRICAVGGAGTDLLAVQGAEHRNIPTGCGIQEATEAAPHALQVIQRLAGNILVFHAPDPGIFPDVQRQVMPQNLAASRFFQKGCQLSGAVLAPQQGIDIHHRVPLVAVVCLTVHVNGYIGNQQQVTVNIHQYGFCAMLRLHHHPSGQAQGTVKPGGNQQPAIALHL